jgi:putative colanic acid biosynthesis UDP-glucose lipid carrier transferase
MEMYSDIPVMHFESFPLDNFFNRLIKRLFDIVFSTAIIVFLLSWLTPLLAVLIRLDSRGSIFFRQERTGLNNRTFYCYKFRTMRNTKDAHELQATSGDRRITKIGRFLRKTSLDEMPQFWNVLKGEMSVVGPRPHMLSHTEEFSNRIQKYMSRHQIKPGITGLAQVRGYRGETVTQSQLSGRIRLDRFYVENWTFLFDLKIIFDTVRLAWRQKEAV